MSFFLIFFQVFVNCLFEKHFEMKDLNSCLFVVWFAAVTFGGYLKISDDLKRLSARWNWTDEVWML